MSLSNLFALLSAVFMSINLIFFTGCTNQEEKEMTHKTAPQPERGGIYRVPLPSNPATLDPAYVQDQYGEAIVHQIFDGLVRFDSYLSILPALAESWQVKEGGRVYRFILNKNARFHNHDIVTSRDVIFSIKRLLRAEPAPAVMPHLLKITGAEEYRSGTRDNLPGFEIENDTIFKINLQEPHAPFLTALGMYQAAIVPEKDVIRLGKDFKKHPVGTGPFRFVSWDEKKIIYLTRFEDYYRGPAFLDEIHFKIYPQGQDLKELTDFKQGNIEEMSVYGDRKEKLADIKGLQWFNRPSLSLFFYGMNVKHPNLADPHLRKALSTAIDRTAFVNQVYKGQFETARTILPPGMPGYSPLNMSEDNNPDLARQYMRRYFDKTDENLPELEIVSAFKTPRVEQEMAMIKEFWSILGIKLRVKYIQGWEKFETYLKSDSVQIYRYAWFADMPDPDSFLYSLFASESPVNFMKLQDENIDQMLLTARGIVDPVKRAGRYQKIEAAIMDSTPLIPLFYMNVNRVYQSYVKSVTMNALGAHTIQFNKIWLDKSIQN